MALLVIDEGTTSTRAMLFDESGTCLGCEQRELTQSYPRSGWVEHDAEEIWRESLACARAVVEAGGGEPGGEKIGRERLAGARAGGGGGGGAGKTAPLATPTQRETIIFGTRRTGRALAPAIVWQDRRTAAACDDLREAGRETLVQ